MALRLLPLFCVLLFAVQACVAFAGACLLEQLRARARALPLHTLQTASVGISLPSILIISVPGWFSRVFSIIILSTSLSMISPECSPCLVWHAVWLGQGGGTRSVVSSRAFVCATLPAYRMWFIPLLSTFLLSSPAFLYSTSHSVLASPLRPRRRTPSYAALRTFLCVLSGLGSAWLSVCVPASLMCLLC